jgi:NADPH:quinone reductase-like Zn-dependent oxidoreductase
VRLIEAGEYRPLVADVYSLPEMKAAQEAFAAKKHVGKLVLKV